MVETGATRLGTRTPTGARKTKGNSMNLNQLTYFISVAELRNFTRAAEQNFISQTAMSQQIKSLERIVGVPLLVRDKHHVELTAAGRVYLAEARRIVQQSDEAMRLARLASTGLQGELTVGYVTGFGKGDFSQHLHAFHKAFPDVKVNLERSNSSVLLGKVAQGACDLALVISSHVMGKFELERRFITSYPIMVVLPADHALAGRERLAYSDLEGERFIMMDPADQPKDQMQESLLIYQRGGYIPNVVAADGEDETVMLMVAAGTGIALIPEYITRHYENDPALKILPVAKVDGTSETLDFEVLWRPDNPNPALEHILDALK